MSSTQQILQMKTEMFLDPTVPRVDVDERWETVIEKVRSHPDHTVLVVDRQSKLVGIITDSDVLKALSDPQLAPKLAQNQIIASDIMTRIDPAKADSVAISTQPVEEAIEKLRKHKFKIIPVVDKQGSPLGQVSKKTIQSRVDALLESK